MASLNNRRFDVASAATRERRPLNPFASLAAVHFIHPHCLTPDLPGRRPKEVNPT